MKIPLETFQLLMNILMHMTSDLYKLICNRYAASKEVPATPPPLQAPPPSFERTTLLTFKESVTNYKET